MKPSVLKESSLAIAFDADLLDAPGREYFSVDYWRSQQALEGEAVGRGSAWFVDAPFGKVVLRQYLRGGWVAKVSRANYFFTSVERSRPFREFDLLADLYRAGLPVPRPVAALCEFNGVISTGSIMTRTVPCAQTLAEVLVSDPGQPDVDPDIWASVGRCIRRFHDAGLWHADLNARNILLDGDHNVFLIDFDRARFSPGKAVKGQGNLHRLRRSLDKFWPDKEAAALQSGWSELLGAYHG